MSTVLKVNNLSKTYITNKRQNNVLRNINFTIEKGEMVAIMGPSGSGKSTLLYNVSGMDTPTAGSVMLAQKEITGMSENELAQIRLDYMGFVFQQIHMLKNLTVMDNILLPAFQSNKDNISKEDKIVRCKELMHKLGINEIAENDITEVSGGQLQRACICRSLINNPYIIFADEPTGALNHGASEEVMRELTRLNKEGTTIMLVTHDMKVAAKCSRIMYIVDGNIKGELSLGTYEYDSEKDRQRKVSNWLEELGW